MLQHPVPEEHLRHIGDMTVSFSLLESVVQQLTGYLVSEQQRIGQIVTAELSFRSLRALAVSLYLERYGEDARYSTLSELMKRAATLEDRRNQIIHSVWAIKGRDREPNTVTRMKRTAKIQRGLRFQSEDFRPDDIADVASDMKKLAQDILDFSTRLLLEGKVE
jgi:hypothetical protein